MRQIQIPILPPTSLSPEGWSYRYIYIYRRLKKRVNREIVSFRLCVRASEALCAREAMLLPIARALNVQLSSVPVRSDPILSGPLRSVPFLLEQKQVSCFWRACGNVFFVWAWESVRCASLSALRLGKALASQSEEFLFRPL